MLQEWHDLIGAVLTHPELTRALDAIVVEFGNAAYQAVCDRFIIDGAPIPRADLVQIWRQIGDPTWNAPVYEQFYRTIRAVNRTRPATRRIRILLGQAPIRMSDVVAHANDLAKAQALAAPMDDHFATIIQRDVLDHGRRALLIAGKGHLLRGLSHRPRQPHPERDHPNHRHHPREAIRDRQPDPPGTNERGHRARESRARARSGRRARRACRNLARRHRHDRRRWLAQRAGRPRTEFERQPLRTPSRRHPLPRRRSPPHRLPARPRHLPLGPLPHQLQRAATLAGAGDQLALAIHWATSPPGYFNLFT